MFAMNRIEGAYPGSKLQKTLIKAADKGELSKFDISRELNDLLKEYLIPYSPMKDIDFSIIKLGSKYDNGPFISLGSR